MVISLAKMVVLWLNNFPPKGGTSHVYSLRQIVLGMKLDIQKHCCIKFGAYAQVLHNRQITNTMEERSTGGICMGPVDNGSGGVSFLNL